MNYTAIIGVAATAALLAGCATHPTYRDPTQAGTLSRNFTAADYAQTAAAMITSLSSSEAVIANVKAYKEANGGLKPIIATVPLVNDTRQMTLKDDLINNTIRTEIVRQGQFTFLGDQKATTDIIFAEGNSVRTMPGTTKGIQSQRGVDYVLTSKLSQLDDEGGRTRDTVYILHMELINQGTGELEWVEDAQIGKYAKRAGVGW